MFGRRVCAPALPMLGAAATPAMVWLIHSRRVVCDFMQICPGLTCFSDKPTVATGACFAPEADIIPAKTLMYHPWNSHRLFSVVLTVITSLCFAQQPTAQITGIITDASGAVIPEARIVAANINTGVEAVTQSNESGNYVFPNLSDRHIQAFSSKARIFHGGAP